MTIFAIVVCDWRYPDDLDEEKRRSDAAAGCEWDG